MATQKVKKAIREDYAAALHKSPKWVKMAFHVYMQLPDKYVLHHPFLYFFLGNKGTMRFKMSPMMSDYGDPRAEGQRCDNCEFAYQKVVSKKFICSKIKGEIKPSKWCKLWAPEKEKKSGMDGSDYETARANETVFRNILKDLKINRRKLPKGEYIPADLQTELPLNEFFEKYSEGDRHGIFTITGFEMPTKSRAIIGFQDVATLSGGGATLEYFVGNSDTVRFNKSHGVFMS